MALHAQSALPWHQRHNSQTAAGLTLLINDPVSAALHDNLPRLSPPEQRTFLTTLLANATRNPTSIASLPATHLAILATHAALHFSPSLLSAALSAGASLTYTPTSLALSLARVPRSAQMLELLYSRNWRDIRTSTMTFDREMQACLYTSATELDWFLAKYHTKGQRLELAEEGKRINAMLRSAIRVDAPPIHADCVALLLRRYGKDVFAQTGALRDAVRRGRAEVVRMFLAAGVSEGLSGTGEREGLLEVAVDGGHAAVLDVLLPHAGFVWRDGEMERAREAARERWLGAEDGQGDKILRMLEVDGERERARL